MAVFRVERNRGYTVMSNHHLRNRGLTLKAKGLLSQMLSLPDNWDYTLAGLSHINREKIDAIREAVRELEKAGYIVRSRERDKKGRLRGVDYIIYEQPQPPVLDLPTLENPTLDNPTLEKPTTKDFIAPSSFRFGEGRYYRMGRKIGAVSFLEILAPELNDRMLADILDLETGIVVNLHIKSIDQTEAIKTIKRKITDLDKMKIEEQKKAVRSGYDMDIIPSDLAMFGGEAKNLLQDLQSRNERMFLLTFLVVNMADTKRKLENDIFAAAGIAQKYNCALTRLDYQQEAGLMSSVPLGENLIPIQRGLTTSSTAIFIPFITQELFQRGAALYYGLNALSSNMILCDRKRLKNPNGLYHKGTGTPRKTQARAPFAAQTDRERRKRAERKNIQKVFGTGSDLHPVFLLFVRGRFRTAQAPDFPVRKQERSFATFYTNRLQNSMRKGAAA